MNNTSRQEARRGQIWADNEPRAKKRARHLRVLARTLWNDSDKENSEARFAYCEPVARDPSTSEWRKSGRVTWISLVRLREPLFSLVEDTPDPA